MDRVLRAGEGKILRCLEAIADLVEEIEDDYVQMSDEELRARPLGRVRWMPDALDDGPLIDLIRDRVADLYLEKPVNPEELVTIVNELLKTGEKTASS